MKVAICMNDEKMYQSRIEMMYALIIDIQKDIIYKKEEVCFCEKNINYISLWLLSKEITLIYIKDTNKDINSYFSEIGIEVRTHQDYLIDSNEPEFPVIDGRLIAFF